MYVLSKPVHLLWMLQLIVNLPRQCQAGEWLAANKMQYHADASGTAMLLLQWKGKAQSQNLQQLFQETVKTAGLWKLVRFRLCTFPAHYRSDISIPLAAGYITNASAIVPFCASLQWNELERGGRGKAARYVAQALGLVWGAKPQSAMFLHILVAAKCPEQLYRLLYTNDPSHCMCLLAAEDDMLA